MSSHPIDETFNVDPAKEVSEIFGMNLVLPDDPNLQTVVKFALQQYKALVEESQLLEAENKLPTLELARDFLNLAKDTMYKESDLQIKHRNVDVRAAGKKSPQQGSLEGETEKPKGSISRDDLLKQLEEGK